MEFPRVNQKSPKHSKANKKKPLKIVYISNPVKFTTRPDQFRAVVQLLTGRHSNAADLPGAYGEVNGFSTAREPGAGMIPMRSEIAHPMNLPDRCHNGASGSTSYGNFEAVLDIFGERHMHELFMMSCDSSRYGVYADADLGLSRV